jgi:acetylcholinesterase
MNPHINSEEIIDKVLIANYSPPIVASQVLDSSVEKLIDLYPDNPAFGSPFNTGNETFGLSPFFKQGAAIGTTT